MSDPTYSAIARQYGYEPLGPRRPAFTNQEVTFTANLQGADLHYPLNRSIFVDELQVNFATRPFGAAPVAAAIFEVLGLIAWHEGPPTSADQGATQFFPRSLSKNDGTFGAVVASGNAASNAGTQWAQNFLWGSILKVGVSTTQIVTGNNETRAVVHPYQYIPEGSTITLHMDEDTTAAVNMDCEIVATLYYTPVRTTKITR